MRLATLFVVATLVAITMAPAMAVDIPVPNGDCETGTWGAATNQNLANWTFSASAGLLANWYTGSNANYLSQHHGGLAGGGAYIKAANLKTCNFKQTVGGMTPGQTYNVSAWLMATIISPYASGAWLSLGAKNSDDAAYTWSEHYSGGTFAQYTVPAVASAAGTIDIQIFADLQDGDVWTSNKTANVLFDDVTIASAPVPEPSSILAMLTGLAGLVGYGIRRRK